MPKDTLGKNKSYTILHSEIDTVQKELEKQYSKVVLINAVPMVQTGNGFRPNNDYMASTTGDYHQVLFWVSNASDEELYPAEDKITIPPDKKGIVSDLAKLFDFGKSF